MSVDGNRFVDPLPQPALALQGAPAAAPPLNHAAPLPYGPAPMPVGKPPPSRKATAALVLGIVAAVTAWVPFLFVLGLAAAVLAIVFGATTLRNLRGDLSPHNRRHRSFSRAALVLGAVAIGLCTVGVWLSVVVYRDFDRYVNVGVYSTTDTSCTVDAATATYRGVITNLSSTTRSYHIVIDFRRAGATSVLASGAADVTNVAPGADASYSATATVSEPAVDCHVATITGPLPFGQS